MNPIKRNIVIAGLLLALIAGTWWLFFRPIDPTGLNRNVAGLGLAIPGDYLQFRSPQAGQVVQGEAEAQAILHNPDPEYGFHLILYIPNPPGLAYAAGGAAPIAKILNPDHLNAPMLPPPAQEGEPVQAGVWSGIISPSHTITLPLRYVRTTAPASATLHLRAFAYDGLSGEPVDEAALTFRSGGAGDPIPAPTPRYSLTPVAVPDKPPGRSFTPTLAGTIQSSSAMDYNQALAGQGITGTDLTRYTENELPYRYRVLPLSQCNYLNVWSIGRAVLEFDTSAVSGDFSRAVLRVRALPASPKNPIPMKIYIYAGRWDWVFGQEIEAGEGGGGQVDVTNAALWSAFAAEPVATTTISGTTATIHNIELPRRLITPGGLTRLMINSSLEPHKPPENSCYSGQPGLGGAIMLPELYIEQ